MKTIDPNSAVKEGEYTNAEESQGVSQQIINIYNRVIDGQRLSPEARKMFLDSAKQQVLTSVRKQEILEKNYLGLAKDYGLDGSKVVQSKLPILGGYLKPIPVKSIKDAEDRLKEGQFFILDGQIGVIE